MRDFPVLIQEFVMKIRTMLILSLMAFSIIPAIIFGIFLSANMNGTAQSQYNLLIEEMTEKTIITLDTYVDTLSLEAKIISTNASIEKYIKSRSASDFEAAKDAAQSFCNGSTIKRVILIDEDGKIILSTENAYKFTLSHEELETFSEESIVISPILHGNKTTDEFEIVSKKVSDGVTMLVFSHGASINEITAASYFPTNGRVAFVDKNGYLVDNKFIGNVKTLSLPDYQPVAQVINSGTGFNENIPYEVGRTQRIAYVSQSESTGWYAIAFAEASSIYAQVSPAMGTLFISITLISIFLSAVYITVVILSTKPLKKIEDTLMKIHRGDYESRIEILNNNEYGKIARVFNSLIDDIIVSERRYRTIVEMSDNVVFEWNFKTNDVTFSNNFNQKFSYRAPSDAFQDSFLVKGKMHPEDVPKYKQDLEKLTKGEFNFKDEEYRWKNIYGDYVWSQIKTSTIRDKNGEIVKIVGVISDIDRAKRNENQLMIKASYDALTGVYNRATIENVINSEIEKKTEDVEDLAILFVDVDNFKIYNDQYSHATGDQVLKFTASTIKSIIDDFGFVGRYGGDEFVLVVRNSQTNNPAEISKKILETLKEGFTGDNDVHLSVNVSIGISIIKDNTQHVEEIISNADDAMYRIKKNGKSDFGYF